MRDKCLMFKGLGLALTYLVMCFCFGTLGSLLHVQDFSTNYVQSGIECLAMVGLPCAVCQLLWVFVD